MEDSSRSKRQPGYCSPDYAPESNVFSFGLGVEKHAADDCFASAPSNADLYRSDVGAIPTVTVEPCSIDFFYQKYKKVGPL